MNDSKNIKIESKVIHIIEQNSSDSDDNNNELNSSIVNITDTSSTKGTYTTYGAVDYLTDDDESDDDNLYGQHLIQEYKNFKTQWNHDPLSHYSSIITESENNTDSSHSIALDSIVVSNLKSAIKQLCTLSRIYLTKWRSYEGLEMQGYYELKYAIIYSRNKLLVQHLNDYFIFGGYRMFGEEQNCYKPMSGGYKLIGKLPLRELLGEYLTDFEDTELSWIETRCKLLEFSTPNRNVIGFNNGMYDMSTGWCYRFDENENDQTRIENVYYIDANFPTNLQLTDHWNDIHVEGMDEWLLSNFKNDKEIIYFFYIFMGYLLSNGNKDSSNLVNWEMQVNFVCASPFYIDNIIVLFKQIYGNYVIDTTTTTTNEINENNYNLIFKKFDGNTTTESTGSKIVTISDDNVKGSVNFVINTPLKQPVNIASFILKANRAFLSYSHMSTFKSLVPKSICYE